MESEDEWITEKEDEWITEKEDACLPEDISWMDVHECFKEDVGTSANKRKRGPRNLNKGKSQIVDLDDDEEEEDEKGDDIDLRETRVFEDEDENDASIPKFSYMILTL
ncbi:hypothetical protein L1887_35672 [Cichorium endivia]|nr:hypothetical protein L1887_35672 [Cichorium endivia]